MLFVLKTCMDSGVPPVCVCVYQKSQDDGHNYIIKTLALFDMCHKKMADTAVPAILIFLIFPFLTWTTVRD